MISKDHMNWDNFCTTIKICNKCDLQQTRTHAICPEGNKKARFMAIAQAPGEQEDKADKMFVGPSGSVLKQLIAQHRLDVKQYYWTNLLKCKLPHNRKPKQREIFSCSEHLLQEIRAVKPEIIVPLGFYAARFIFKHFNLEFPPEKAKFHKKFGILRWTGKFKIIPLAHPASILHRPELKDKISAKYSILKTLETYCRWHRSCPMKKFTEKGLIDPSWRQLYCLGNWQSCVRFQMESRGQPHPDWMLPDGTLMENLKQC
ncbi:MAG: uracil-DNA glycosylase [Candidatus Cloacimonadota bacterium]|nr:uracil-DNA glycosylase [Candidatus Cloacimonadota bacterium]